ncbi:uncharacterized protein MONBRDRAFT_31164 [Monosiga brevicollis MX1]|uniref:Protein AATF n=1 Tax=Monosiga brevicollis TaxID=81824 RepID=A9US45_MONBE|nr:uncharacterized protein MONBRDRAFT_31164 [Monosiga brevicollis MX1]EDQ91716.1 predicted protein [Monosiga brevicollis MX1]|eukprot:XP_001743002.1 hypothetical protein [Monosiga brevicollis MX1]
MAGGRSFLQELAELNNTRPADVDPENATLDAADPWQGVKGSRRQPHLGEDPRYRGRAVSRRDILEQEDEDDEEDEDDNESVGAFEDDEDEDVGEMVDQDDEMDDDEDDDEDGDDDDEESGDDGNVSMFSRGNASGNDDDQLQRELKQLAQEEAAVAQSLTSDTAAQRKKGEHARNQLALWDAALEARIRIQPALAAANRLPQPERFDDLMADFQEELAGCTEEVIKLAEAIAQLQQQLQQQHESSSHLELPSPTIATTEGAPSAKRAKMADEELSAYISAVEAEYGPVRDQLLDKWSRKTRLATGRGAKQFKALDRGLLQQISDVAEDMPRLIARTRVKRFQEDILGFTPPEQLTLNTDGPVQCQQDLSAARGALGDDDSGEEDPDLPRDALVNRRTVQPADTVADIFDDVDFYHEQLRELIERRTKLDSMDPIEMGRHYVQIDKLRAKTKRLVDTKASKGRKVRYDVQPKLVNLMAPNETAYEASDAARDTLFASLFGK